MPRGRRQQFDGQPLRWLTTINRATRLRPAAVARKSWRTVS
ncbi:hypothetical protein BZL30_4847 [Mycobacterium kansasii]|uniref:Uncharacterized protein n=1 Tax=Mycobacterium kansasii TaxID=1768 RepID=A0A1V3X2E7_MYCKA|nr:hypothetical protein BZL30_4847 [Mycobacterium kansasii]